MDLMHLLQPGLNVQNYDNKKHDAVDKVVVAARCRTAKSRCSQFKPSEICRQPNLINLQTKVSDYCEESTDERPVLSAKA